MTAHKMHVKLPVHTFKIKDLSDQLVSVGDDPPELHELYEVPFSRREQMKEPQNFLFYFHAADNWIMDPKVLWNIL